MALFDDDIRGLVTGRASTAAADRAETIQTRTRTLDQELFSGFDFTKPAAPRRAAIDDPSLFDMITEKPAVDPTLVDSAGKQAFEAEQKASAGRIQQMRTDMGDPDDANPVERMLNGLASGVHGALGSTAEYLGRTLGVKAAEEFGQHAQEVAGAEMVSDPTLADEVLSGVGSTAIFLVPGLGAAGVVQKAAQALGMASKAVSLGRIAGAGTSATLEAAGVAQEAYDKVMAETGNKELAEERAFVTGLVNLPIVYLTDKLGFFGDAGSALRKIGTTMVTEGTQEAAQQVLTNVAGFQAPIEGAGHSFLVGALAGGGVRGIQLSVENYLQKATQEAAADPGTQAGARDVVIDYSKPPSLDELVTAVQTNPNATAAVAALVRGMVSQNNNDAAAFVQKLRESGYEDAAQTIADAAAHPQLVAAGDQIAAQFPGFMSALEATVTNFVTDPVSQLAPISTQNAGQVVDPAAVSPDQAVDQQLDALVGTPEVDSVEQPLPAVEQQPQTAGAENAIPDTSRKSESPIPEGLVVAPATRQAQLFQKSMAALDERLPGSSAGVAVAKPDKVRDDIAKRVKDAFGIDVLYVDGLKQRGFSMRGEKAIVISTTQKDAGLANVVGHELTHQLKDNFPVLWKPLHDAVLAHVSKSGSDRLYAALGGALKQEQGEVTAEQLAAEFDDEIVSEVAGEVWADPKFWEEAFAQAKDVTFAQKMLGTIKGLLNKIQRTLINHGLVRGVKNVEAVRKAVAQAFQNWERLQRATKGPAVDTKTLVEAKTGVSKKAAPLPAGIGEKSAAKQRELAARDKAAREQGEAATKAFGIEEPKATEETDITRLAEDKPVTPEKKVESAPVLFARKSDAGHRRVEATGRYVGAPQLVNASPAALGSLRKKLKRYVELGKVARYWYEDSSKAVLDMFGGDKVEAERFVALLAIYSPHATVAANTSMALNAYYQWKTGQPIKAGTELLNRKADALLNHGEYWSGIKTNNFYQNLMLEIDPSKVTEGAATRDVWMNRAFGYDRDTFGEQQYHFMHRETKRLAEELGDGWTPHQVQAAIWTGIKAESEGKVPQDAGYHFGDALRDRTVQLSWEATPGATTGVLPGLLKAPIDQKMAYFKTITERLYRKGRDIIAEKIGLPNGVNLTGFSAWQGDIGVGGQSFIPVRPFGQGGKRDVDPNAKRLLNLYSALKGYILSQEAVVWHHPIYDTSKKAANGYEATFNRGLTADEMSALYTAIHNQFGTWDLAPGYTPTGVRVLNFTDISNPDFQAGMQVALETLPEDFGGGLVEVKAYRSVGDYISNDWEAHPDGQQYLETIEGAAAEAGIEGRSDLQAWADGVRAGVEAINKHYAEKYGWGEWRQPQSRVAADETLTPVRFSRDILDDVLAGKFNGGLEVHATTPEVVVSRAGFPQLPVAVHANTVRKISSGKDGQREFARRDRLVELLTGIDKPFAVFRSLTDNDSAVLLAPTTSTSGDPFAVPIKKNVTHSAHGVTSGGRKVVVQKQVNEITSAYPKPAFSLVTWARDPKKPLLAWDAEVAQQILPPAIFSQINQVAKAQKVPPVQLARQLQPTVGANFTLPAETGGQRVRRLLQDRMTRVRVVQEAVAEQGGVINEASDIYRAEERFSGRVASRLEDFRKRRLEKFVDNVAKANVDLDELALFLYARHAQERNAWIAQINPSMPDGGSGMTNAEASRLLQTFRADPKWNDYLALSQQLDAIQKDTRRILVDAGLITQAVADAWEQRAAHYVPLRGFEKMDERGERSAGIGRGFDLRGPESRRALGRESRAGQIVENIMAMHERAVIRAEKNRVGKTLLNFVLSNPDSQLWEIDRHRDTPYFAKNGQYNMYGLLDGEVRYKGQVVTDPKSTVVVKHNGQEFAIFIKDPQMQESLTGKGGSLTDSEEMGRFLRAWMGMNRFLAKMWTSLNPVFMATNFSRDLVTGLIHATNVGGPGFAARVFKDMASAMAGIREVERKGTTTGRWAQVYDQYKHDGGKAGFYFFGNLEERQEEIRQLYTAAANMQKGGAKGALARASRFIQKAEDVIMDYNGVIENALRVSAYKNAIESGMSRAEAASIAKNLTVNFNRKGQLTPALSAMFLFFNPAVQGTTRIMQAARRHPMQFASLMAGLSALGIFLAMLGMDDEDEQGVPYWDKIPAFEKQRNIVVMLGGGERINIPVPYGYGWFISLGYSIAELMRGKSPVKAGHELLNAAANHFNPLGGELSVSTIVPTALDPVFEVALNQSAFGQPVMPDEKKVTGETVPDSERVWASHRYDAFHKVAAWLNELTGGNQVEPGKVLGFDTSFSPETFRTFVRYYTGGAGKFILDTVESTYNAFALGPDVPIEKNSIPFMRQLYKRGGVREDQSYYYAAREEAITALAHARAYADDPKHQERIDSRSQLVQLGEASRSMQKALGSLRLQEIDIEESGLSAREKYDARKAIDEERKSLLQEFNGEFYRAERASRGL